MINILTKENNNVPTFISTEISNYIHGFDHMRSGTINGIYLFGSRCPSDQIKNGDIDLILLISTTNFVKFVYEYSKLHQLYAKKNIDVSKFHHPPLFVTTNGLVFLGPTRIIDICNRHMTIMGDFTEINRLFENEINRNYLTPFQSFVYWSLLEICRDLINTIVETFPRNSNIHDIDSFWKRINRRLIDLIFYGFRLSSYLHDTKWTSRNVDLFQLIKDRYHIEFNVDWFIKEKKNPSFIRSELVMKSLDTLILEILRFCCQSDT